MRSELERAIRKIKIILADMDGVFTDGTIYKGNDGMELKRFSVLDSAGVALARVVGMKMAIISGRHSPATDARVREMGLENECYQGGLNKMDAYRELKHKHHFKDDEAVFIGDDIIDLPIMETVGFPIAVANAHPLVKQAARLTTEARGGEGAVREVIELILRGQEIYESALLNLRQGITEKRMKSTRDS